MQTDSKADKEGADNNNGEEIAFCAQCQTTMTGCLHFCRWCGTKLDVVSMELREPPQPPEKTGDKPTSTAGASAAATTALSPTPTSAVGGEKPPTGNLPMPRPTPNGWDWNEVEAALPRSKPRTKKLPEKVQPSVPTSSPRRTGRIIAVVGSCLLILSLAVGGWLLWNRSAGSTAEEASTEMPASRSFFGTSEFMDAEGGGATFNYVYPPGSPADKAGLIGGDIIVSYNARSVRNAEDLKRLVLETPIGQTVQVVYIRDGKEETTKVTTVSKNEMERLDNAHDERVSGKGFMGEGNDLKRVLVPGMNIYGAQINSIRPNMPADRAGLLNGDIVIELDGTPIRTHKELEIRIERSIPNTVVKLVVIRDGKRLEIPVQLERTY